MLYKDTQFTATKFESAAQKAKFANHFIKFISNGFKESQFPKWFYQRLSMCRGHIAHYNQAGFYDTWFFDRESQKKFINYWIKTPIYGDPEWTYSDVEEYLSKWLKTQDFSNLEESYQI